MFVYTKENGIQQITRIPVKYSISVKYEPTEYKGYRSVSLFGGTYKVTKPRVETSIRFMEVWNEC